MEKICLLALAFLAFATFAHAQNNSCFAPAFALAVPAENANIPMLESYRGAGILNFDGKYHYLESAIAGSRIAILPGRENVTIEFESPNPDAVENGINLLSNMQIIRGLAPEYAGKNAVPEKNATCRQVSFQEAGITPAAHQNEAGALGAGSNGMENAKGGGNLPGAIGAQSGGETTDAKSAQKTGAPAMSPIPPAIGNTAKVAEGAKQFDYNLLIPLIAGTAGVFFLAVMAFYFRQRAPLGQEEIPHEVYLGSTQSAILGQLEEAERIPTDIAARVGKSKSTVVEHLDSLVQQGFVERLSTPSKKFVFYRLSGQGRRLLLKKRNAG